MKTVSLTDSSLQFFETKIKQQNFVETMLSHYTKFVDNFELYMEELLQSVISKYLNTYNCNFKYSFINENLLIDIYSTLKLNIEIYGIQPNPIDCSYYLSNKSEFENFILNLYNSVTCFEFDKTIKNDKIEIIKNFFNKSDDFLYNFSVEYKRENEKLTICILLTKDENHKKIFEDLQNIKKENSEKLLLIQKKLKNSTIKKIQSDPRITNVMIDLYKKAIMINTNEHIQPPNYILDNLNSSKKEFYNYLINVNNLNDTTIFEKNKLFNNSYSIYMSYMTDIKIPSIKIPSIKPHV